MKIIKWLGIIACVLGLQAYAGIETVKLPDGAHLRVGSWDSKTPNAHGTIILLVGRASYLEKNEQLIEDLRDQGFNVESFDWRGHGGSSRLLLHPQKCHIDSFDTYLKDLEYYLATHVTPRRPGPWLLVGISLGGHLALRYAHDHPQQFKRVALVVPMFEMVTKPYPREIVGPLVKLMSFFGFKESYAFGYYDINLQGPIPLFSRETHDLEQHRKTQALMRRTPEFVISGPTFGWVSAAVDSIAVTKQPGYFDHLPPTEIYLASHDHLVDNAVTQQKCKQMPQCRCLTYPNSYHNLTKERKETRQAFLKDMVSFLKG